ncbi:hypothetical protein BRC82_06640 [Halobacteriales archaeon QS_1_67_19]|nr:MAG: hypothetical protein BRC82_06640 [Halobacteriales archaeon QS_1_67_19]
MEYALVLLWFVVFQALALLALPLVARLFSGFPDRGASFALPTALVVVTTVVYWVGHLRFDRLTAVLGVLALGGLAGLALWRDRPVDGSALPTRAYAKSMIVFALAFGLLIAVRAVDPAIVPGGGEKFLDFGIYKSLLRDGTLPPQDMWWAGEHVVYYYGGHLMTATLTYLTGTAPRYGYNLALAGFYASLVTAAYGLGVALADARGARPSFGGGLAAFFVGFASNLVVPITGLIWLLPESLARAVADRVVDSLRSPEGNLAHAGELVREGLSEFGYWAPSRVIPGTINEFPLFAFYNGDLHGHMLSTQFLVLVAALGFAYYRTAPENLGRRRLLAFGALPVVVAFLGLVNVWSLPTGLGVAWLALLFAPADTRSLFTAGWFDTAERPVSDGGSGRSAVEDRGVFEGDSPGTALLEEVRRILSSLASAGVVAALTVAWLSPFVASVLLGSASNRSLDVLPTPSTAIALALVHGAFLAVGWCYLWPRAKATFSIAPLRAVVLGALVAVLSWLVGYAVLALVVPVLLLGWLLLRADPDTGYETVLLVAGAGLVTLVEFAYVEDNAISGRFNTVFKVYMQVWVLWGTAAGGMLAALLSERAGPPTRPLSLGDREVARADLLSVLAAVLVVSTGMYGGFTMANHFAPEGEFVEADQATLDGLAYVETRHPDEAEAIQWLDDREGQPHVLTAPGSPYQWSSPVPSLTGLPAVVGWVYQEGAYRGYEKAEARERDVDNIYTNKWDDRDRLLRKYDVEYIYVGPRVRERYPEAALEFADEPGIEVAFENDGVVIYRVDR